MRLVKRESVHAVGPRESAVPLLGEEGEIFMNIVILTGKFGMGHLSAANALREQLVQDGHRADIIDLFE